MTQHNNAELNKATGATGITSELSKATGAISKSKASKKSKSKAPTTRMTMCTTRSDLGPVSTFYGLPNDSDLGVEYKVLHTKVSGEGKVFGLVPYNSNESDRIAITECSLDNLINSFTKVALFNNRGTDWGLSPISVARVAASMDASKWLNYRIFALLETMYGEREVVKDRLEEMQIESDDKKKIGKHLVKMTSAIADKKAKIAKKLNIDEVTGLLKDQYVNVNDQQEASNRASISNIQGKGAYLVMPKTQRYQESNTIALLNHRTKEQNATIEESASENEMLKAEISKLKTEVDRLKQELDGYRKAGQQSSTRRDARGGDDASYYFPNFNPEVRPPVPPARAGSVPLNQAEEDVYANSPANRR